MSEIINGLEVTQLTDDKLKLTPVHPLKNHETKPAVHLSREELEHFLDKLD